MTSSQTDDRLGKLAYDAYMTQIGDIGNPWDGLKSGEQTAWITAARTIEYAVAAYVEEEYRARDDRQRDPYA